VTSYTWQLIGHIKKLHQRMHIFNTSETQCVFCTPSTVPDGPGILPMTDWLLPRLGGIHVVTKMLMT
jgi:hypothetical protein